MFRPEHRPRLIPALVLGAALVFAGVRGVHSRGHSAEATQAVAAPASPTPADSGEPTILIVTGNHGAGLHP